MIDMPVKCTASELPAVTELQSREENMAYCKPGQGRWNVAANPRSFALTLIHGTWAPQNFDRMPEWAYAGAWLRAAWLTGGTAIAMFIVLTVRFFGEAGWTGTRTGPRFIEATRLACPVPCIRTAGDEATKHGEVTVRSNRQARCRMAFSIRRHVSWRCWCSSLSLSLGARARSSMMDH